MSTETRFSRITKALNNIASAEADKHRQNLEVEQGAVTLAATAHEAACAKEQMIRRAESFRAEVMSAICMVVCVARKYPGMAEKLPVGFDDTADDPMDVGRRLHEAYKGEPDMKAVVWILGQALERASEAEATIKSSDAVKCRKTAKSNLRIARNRLEAAKLAAENFIIANTSEDSATRMLLQNQVRKGKGKRKASEVIAAAVEVTPAPQTAATEPTVTVQPIAAVRAA